MRITLEISSIPIQLQFILEYQELMEHLPVKEIPMLRKMRYFQLHHSRAASIL